MQIGGSEAMYGLAAQGTPISKTPLPLHTNRPCLLYTRTTDARHPGPRHGSECVAAFLLERTDRPAGLVILSVSLDPSTRERAAAVWPEGLGATHLLGPGTQREIKEDA